MTAHVSGWRPWTLCGRRDSGLRNEVAALARCDRYPAVKHPSPLTPHAARPPIWAGARVVVDGIEGVRALLRAPSDRVRISGERHQMADAIPFVMAGVVVSWDPVPRILYVGSARLDVAPGVGVEALVPSQRVTVTGHRPKQDGGRWVVTKIEAHRPGF
jgi:hypothetical protein